jgi:hypothetical protein
VLSLLLESTCRQVCPICSGTGGNLVLGIFGCGAVCWRGPTATCCVQILGPRNETGRNLCQLSLRACYHHHHRHRNFAAGMRCPCVSSERFFGSLVTISGVVAWIYLGSRFLAGRRLACSLSSATAHCRWFYLHLEQRPRNRLR